MVRPVALAAIAALAIALGAHADPENSTSGNDRTQLANQAGELWDQGRFAEAEALHVKVVAIDETRQIVDGEALADDLRALAQDYFSERRYAEATPLLRRALKLSEETCGPSYPGAEGIREELADTLVPQADLGEARQLYQQVLATVRFVDVARQSVVECRHTSGEIFYSWDGSTDNPPGNLTASQTLQATSDFTSYLAVSKARSGLATIGLMSQDLASAERLERDEVAFARTIDPKQRTWFLREGLQELAMVQQFEGKLGEAEGSINEACELVKGADPKADASYAMCLRQLASLYLQQGRFPQAEETLDRFDALVTAGDADHDLRARLSLSRASLYVAQAKFDSAEPLLLDALAAVASAHDEQAPVDLAQALSLLATVRVSQGRLEEAATLAARESETMQSLNFNWPYLRELNGALPALLHDLQTAGDTLSASGSIDAPRGDAQGDAVAPWMTGLLLEGHALSFDLRGDHSKAEPLYGRAVAILQRTLGPSNPNLLDAEDLEGLNYLAERKLDEAGALLKTVAARRQAAFGPASRQVAESLADLSLLSVARGDVPGAQDEIRRALLTLDERRDVNGSFDTTLVAQRVVSQYLHIQFDPGFAPASGFGADQISLGFEGAQLVSPSNSALSIAAMETRFSVGSNALASMIRRREDLERRLTELRDESLATVAFPRSGHRDTTSSQDSLDRIENDLTRSDALIARRFPAYAQLTTPAPVTLRAAQTALRGDEALIVYLEGESGCWLWVVRHHSAEMVPLTVSHQELSSQIDELLRYLNPVTNPNLQPLPVALSHLVYSEVLAAAQPYLAGVGHLIIKPSGALVRLPFAVLIDSPPGQPPTGIDGAGAQRWLIRDYAISETPSIGSFYLQRHSARQSRATRPFFGIGDPDLPASAASTTVATFAQLPEAAAELRDIATDLQADPADVLTGERATALALEDEPLSRFRVVAFATHAIPVPTRSASHDPDQIALVLDPSGDADAHDDGLVTPDRVASLSLDADFVILSACDTAGSDPLGARVELANLGEAFFYAGARSILVSSWPISSRAAVALTTGAIEEMHRSPAKGRAAALRHSILAMLDNRDDAELAHPSSWAAFTLQGEGGADR